MSVIKINESFDIENLNFMKGMETKENIKYIENNWDRIIESEEESTENYINDATNSIDALMDVRDNQGEFTITNDDGEEIASVTYWAEIAGFNK